MAAQAFLFASKRKTQGHSENKGTLTLFLFGSAGTYDSDSAQSRRGRHANAYGFIYRNTSRGFGSVLTLRTTSVRATPSGMAAKARGTGGWMSILFLVSFFLLLSKCEALQPPSTDCGRRPVRSLFRLTLLNADQSPCPA